MKKKLQLEDLKIKSFISSLTKEKSQTIVGGESGNPICVNLSGIGPFCVQHPTGAVKCPTEP